MGGQGSGAEKKQQMAWATSWIRIPGWGADREAKNSLCHGVRIFWVWEGFRPIVVPALQMEKSTS